ncbi:MAG: hypothetical protein KBB88_03070 [Candidatus Pacebacteria bacterium]|nr:hypothetical protein [Candidatus Paceibacterota bacterium]
MEKIDNNLDSDSKNTETDIAELKNSLEHLEETIRVANSTKKAIWLGIVRGLSGAVGATIVFALLLSFISGILYATGLFPELNNFISSIVAKDKDK